MNLHNCGTILEPYINVPRKCPKCDGAIALESVHFICPNIDCSGLIFGNMQRWIIANNIMGIGPSIIRELINLGYDTPAKLYEAPESVLEKASGSAKIAAKLKQVIDKTRTIRLDSFLYGLNVDALGSTNSTRLAKKFDSLAAVMKASDDDIASIDGIATNAKKIRTGLLAKVNLIRELIKNVKVKSVSDSGPLGGASICITGELWTSRPEIHRMIQEAGGEVKTSVSRGLTFLATNDPKSGTSKNKKAESIGTKVISGDTLKDLIDGKVAWKTLL